jgi:ferrous iron transport protein B
MFNAPGWLVALVSDGVGSALKTVGTFLPPVGFMFLCLSVLEDSGYMARAAFVMDRFMRWIGLPGKSFVPMLVGFGCSVPAIMATRTIESHSSRLITILITPFMSCSARLPVFILLAGTFFPQHAPIVMIGLYLFGILIAAITARLLRLVKYKTDETPFVMELPPYRWPTLRSTLRHMWEKCEQYIKKVGTIVLASTVIIWFLSYFPRPTETAPDNYSQSYIGMIGKAIEPVMEPLGLNWRSSIALITSIPAKELVVSTLGVLYSSNTEEGIKEDIKASGDFTPRSAMSFMVFILLFFPCIATVASIAEETKSKWWALFSIVYNTGIAWLLAFAAYTIGGIV